MRFRLLFAFCSLAIACALGCSNNSAKDATSGTASDDNAAKTSASTTSAAPVTPPPASPAATNASGTSDVSAAPKAGDDVAVIKTNLGTIVFKFLPDKAPKTVDNFKSLASKGFYNGVKFHRVIPTFMIQGGDPNTKTKDRQTYGTGGPGYTVPDEFSDISHVRGIVSMANTGRPNSGGSQFFIVVADHPDLDGKYSVFGYVVKGMDVADKIVDLPRDPVTNDPLLGHEAVMKSVKIEKWPVK